MSTFPFKATLEEIISGPENYVDSVFSCLESEFLVMPKGHGFVEYPAFEGGYEALKVATIGGRGFGVRREDMKKMLLATRGKVFTAKTLAHIVECSQLKKFKTI